MVKETLKKVAKIAAGTLIVGSLAFASGCMSVDQPEPVVDLTPYDQADIDAALVAQSVAYDSELADVNAELKEANAKLDANADIIEEAMVKDGMIVAVENFINGEGLSEDEEVKREEFIEDVAEASEMDVEDLEEDLEIRNIDLDNAEAQYDAEDYEDDSEVNGEVEDVELKVRVRDDGSDGDRHTFYLNDVSFEIEDGEVVDYDLGE